MLKSDSKEYVESCINRELTDKELIKINKHCKRFDTYEICAWYVDWEDFCSDWCNEIGYNRTEARSILHGKKGEFMIIDSIGILRFCI